jgi:hypothetical protein
MDQLFPRGIAAVMVTALTVAGLLPGTVAAAPRDPSHAAIGSTAAIDLAAALSDDGTFTGQRGVSGSVDASAWVLTSDISSGAAPRFAPAAGERRLTATSQAVSGSWAGVGSNGSGDGPIQTTGASVRAIAVQGSTLYVGGLITNVGGIAEADFIARWDGSAWHSLGGSGGDGPLNGHVETMAFSGTNLYVGGSFTDASGIATADFVAMWNGSFWSALGSNFAGNGALNNSVSELTTVGTSVYVAGFFTDAATMTVADRLAVWNGSSWQSFSTNAVDHPDSQINTLVAHGGYLYAGGFFQNIGGLAAADFIARWNWNNWEVVGNGLDGGPEAIAFTAGGQMYVGGSFINAGGQATADYVTRLDGSSWGSLGSDGAGNGALNGTVRTIAFVGSNVVLGGQFTNAGGVGAADRIAAWDGSAYTALGSNGGGDGALNGMVRALAVGASLVAGGEFTDAAGVATADYVATFGPLASYQPDGRIRKGSGTLAGNNVYNTTGVNQTRTGSAAPGRTITFRISGQNDGSVAGRLRLSAAGTAVTGYVVKYFNGSTEVTAAVNAGTFQTPVLAVGGTFLLTAKVTVKAAAAGGSSVSRLVTARSVDDPSKLDVVRFIGKRS